MVVGEQLDLSAGMGQFVESGKRDVGLIADAVYIDGDLIGERVGKNAADESDHVQMKAGVAHRCKEKVSGLMRPPCGIII
jgi:hypothetical protein